MRHAWGKMDGMMLSGQGCHIGRLLGKSRPKDVVRARPDERPSRPTTSGRPICLADGPGGRHLPDGQSCGRAHSHPTAKQPGT
jgi:hypothetical protein